MQITILVGAGASFGAFDNQNLKPPLGSELFSKLAQTFPKTWGNLPKSVVKEFKTSKLGFENGMAALRAEGNATQNALIDMSIYFASFLAPNTAINRYRLLGELLSIYRPRISYSFASLNYECLLEQGLELSNHQIYWWGPFGIPLRNPVLVLKPHGSCHFVADTGNNTFQGNTFIGVGVYIEAPLKVVSLSQVVAEAQTTGFPSAMSLYAPGKPNVVSPSFVEKFRMQWKEMTKKSDVIIVIGARPVIESDPHIWGPIIDSSAKVLFIGTNMETLQHRLGKRLTNLALNFETSLEPLKEWLERAT